MRESPRFTERELMHLFRPMTKPSIEAWELFWTLDEDQRREMASMLASFAAMIVIHHREKFQQAHA